MSRIAAPLVTAMTVLLFVVAAHADEDEYDEEETATESAPADDPVTVLLQSEVLRYYRGIGADSTEAELKSGLDAAFDMLLADVSIGQITAAVDEAVERHEAGVDVPFAVAVSRFVRALAEEAHAEQSEASELALQRARRAGARSPLKQRTTEELLRDRKKGKGLMTAAFVAQGISLGTTFASIFFGDIMAFSWVVQAATIPFAPMGVGGFALRYGGSSESRRLHWTGIGLLEAAAFAALVGGVNLAAVFSPIGYGDFAWIFAFPGSISHFGASIAFGIAGGVCVGVAKAQARRQMLSQSRRSPARRSHRGFVMPTIAPRPGGLSLGLAGVF